MTLTQEDIIAIVAVWCGALSLFFMGLWFLFAPATVIAAVVGLIKATKWKNRILCILGLMMAAITLFMIWGLWSAGVL